jgi:SagB-type dehydrogenase family enzyme
VIDLTCDVWEATSLSDATAAAFGARIAAAPAPAPTTGIHPFVGPASVIPLERVDDRFQRMLAARRSERRFGPRPLRARDVARVLAAVGTGRDRRSLVPSAGGFASVFAYAIGHRVEGPLGGRVVRYDAAAHGVADIGPAPDEERLRRLLLVDDDADTPPLVVVLVIDDAPTVTKYGDRGLRFVLQQAGHAAQNIGLRLAADGLAGYVLGGGLDREILDILGLASTRARYGTAVACGPHP